MSIVVLVSLLSGLAGIAGFVLRFVDIDKLSERYKMPQAAFIALALSPLVIATGLFILIAVLDSDSSDGDTVSRGPETPTPTAVFDFNAFSAVFDETTGNHENPVDPGGVVSVCPDGSVYASVHYDRLPVGTRLTGMWVRGAVVLQQDVARNDDLTGNLWWRMNPVDMTADHFQLWREDQKLGEWAFSLFCGSPTPTPKPTPVPAAPTFPPSGGTPTPTSASSATFEVLGFGNGDNSGDAPPPSIPPGDTIVCDLDVLYVWIRHEGLAPGVTITGRWTFNGAHIAIGDGAFSNENENDDIWFKLDLGLWEDGAYQFEESVDGNVVASANLQVAGC